MKRVLAVFAAGVGPVLGAPQEVDRFVERLDSSVAGALVARGVTPNPPAPEGVWLRRVYLDLVGRIPSAAEARAFLGSDAPGKRDALIVELQESPGRASHEFSFWSDVLRVPSRVNGQNGAATMRAYGSWLHEQFEANLPYDELVRTLVTARGYFGENPAVGFTLRDRGMPLDHMSVTVETFLGTQMLCAQCHDHPYADWTQRDFYGLAAFSYGMKESRIPEPLEAKMRGAFEDVPRAERRKLRRSAGLLFAPFQNAYVEERPRRLVLPDDYQYEDGEPGERVVPEVPFGPEIVLDHGASRVEAYAEWMTSAENPRFAKVGANRMWKRFFGVGVLEPANDFDREDEAFSVELLGVLGELFVETGFDLKLFSRVLVNSDLYARAAVPLEEGVAFSFAGPALRRMTAEQVWDSMVTLVRKDVDTAVLPGKAGTTEPLVSGERLAEVMGLGATALAERLEQTSDLAAGAAGALAPLREKTEAAVAKKKAGEKDARAAGMAAARDLARHSREVYTELARLMMVPDVSDVGRVANPVTNGPRQLARVLTNHFPQSKRLFEDLYPQYRSAGKNRGKNLTKAEVEARVREVRKSGGKEAVKAFFEKRGKRGLARYVRASRLPQPAPDGHFLRTFGQSDREASGNGSADATVPQALALLNGPVFSALRNPVAEIRQAIDTAEGVSGKADAIYLSTLARLPGAGERKIVEAALASGEPRSAEGVVWALLNSPQFLFIE